MNRRTPVFRTVTLIGGCGAVATLFARTLPRAATTTFTLVDVDPRASATALAWTPGILKIQDDIRHPKERTLEAIAGSDLVILATPEEVAAEAAPAVLRQMRNESLLVETLSVKSGFARAIQRSHSGGAQLNGGPELLGINPMFAPSLGFAGRGVVAVPYFTDARAEAFIDFIQSEDARVVRMDAEQHDRACALLQACTHAAVLSFGMALRASGYDVRALEPIIPPPHRMLLALLARILSSEPQVYRDIQAENPFAQEARLRLAQAQSTLDENVKTGNSADFAHLLDNVRELFAGSDTEYARICAGLFADSADLGLKIDVKAAS